MSRVNPNDIEKLAYALSTGFPALPELGLSNLKCRVYIDGKIYYKHRKYSGRKSGIFTLKIIKSRSDEITFHLWLRNQSGEKVIDILYLTLTSKILELGKVEISKKFRQKGLGSHLLCLLFRVIHQISKFERVKMDIIGVGTQAIFNPYHDADAYTTDPRNKDGLDVVGPNGYIYLSDSEEYDSDNVDCDSDNVDCDCGDCDRDCQGYSLEWRRVRYRERYWYIRPTAHHDYNEPAEATLGHLRKKYSPKWEIISTAFCQFDDTKSGRSLFSKRIEAAAGRRVSILGSSVIYTLRALAATEERPVKSV